MAARVRALTPDDIPAAKRLKEAAGWNQTEQDWRNVLALAPDTCFGLECDGTLAATTTAVCYGQRLAWIGMVLTAPEHRRRGFARMLLEHAIEVLEARQVDWIKLDATDMGAPLYRDLGFEDEGFVERWRGTAAGAGQGSRSAWGADLDQLDRDAFGADRAELLGVLAPMGVSTVPGQGYAMLRPGSQMSYFGPCVCRRPEAALELIGRAAAGPMYWDLLDANPEAVRLVRDLGFERARRLVRMARRGRPGGAPLACDDRLVYAIAGFEYG